MSDSPQSPQKDVEQGVPSPEDGEPPMDNTDPHTGAPSYGEFEVKEQDRWLPIANVARIMKMALPENAKIAKEAKECMQECVSEFISFITSEASEKCQQEKRKTVNGEDILFAMTSLGFENYAEALKIYLSKYRETMSNRGETQNRPSSGYGQAGGPSGTNASQAGFQGDDSSALLNQQGDAGAAAPYMYDPQGGHNGTAGGTY
ncbi:hypothetical protein MKZ38_003629 [Zalerion maritima]|uniref:Transcription factor CBF/NF-Y/archaeal histone domain-containing protein n=1 Tax=Zalerion maritima TaxID=339359 RepID=A0AAD5RNW4_9PEZI|nr:hypothetical protein MKZ38_003629 [Zalerion maritima]